MYKRAANPTASTPTEFETNWDYCENGPSDPQPDDNVTTFMGPSITEQAGAGIRPGQVLTMFSR